MPEAPILQIDSLSVSFGKGKKMLEVLHKISFDLNQNEIAGLVGESGSGKSVTSLAIMGLLPKGIGRITSGSITFNQTPLTALSQKEL